MSAWTRDLLTGFAVLLAEHDVGTWIPSGKYGEDQIAITIGGLPAKPDTAITLAVYGVGQAGDDVEQADSSVQLQARMRAKTDPRVVDDLADGVFDVIHGLASVRLSTGVLVLLARRTLVAPLGRDTSGRWERADSYDLMVHRPSPNRDL
ncbi:minor capsid protein (plasmid) [Microtetraspora malaysiensis]|uniref:minor capsid protein n=1 Tax=Microtetraspora malaysiensis TaxID=161358 RepID=UPI003D91712C